MANNSKDTPAVRYPENIYRRNRSRYRVGEKQRALQSIQGRQAQTAVATPNVL